MVLSHIKHKTYGFLMKLVKFKGFGACPIISCQ